MGSNNELEIKVVLNNSQDAGSGLNVSTAIKEFPIFFLDFQERENSAKFSSPLIYLINQRVNL